MCVHVCVCMCVFLYRLINDVVEHRCYNAALMTLKNIECINVKRFTLELGIKH